MDDWGFYDAGYYGGYDGWNFDVPQGYDYGFDYSDYAPSGYDYGFDYGDYTAPTYDYGAPAYDYSAFNSLPAVEAAAMGGPEPGAYLAGYNEEPMSVGGSPRLATPELTSAESRLASIGKPPTAEASPWYKAMLDNAINAGKSNPLAALSLLGGGAAAVGGLSQSGAGKVTVPQRTTELSPQEQALVSRGTAPLRDSPAALQKYAELREALENRSRQELGPGYQQTTPYMEAKKRLEQQIDADLYQRESGDRTNALTGFSAIQGTGSQTQQLEVQAQQIEAARRAQEQQNLFGLAGTLGGLGTVGMMYGNQPRRPATRMA